MLQSLTSQAPRSGVVAAHFSSGSVVSPTFLLNPSSSSCFPCLSQLPSRGDGRPGIFNPVKPLLLIMPDRASSLLAMPAVGWMLLLFLSDLLSLPHPRGTSSSACAQLPSCMVKELLEQKGLHWLTLKMCKVLFLLLPCNSKVSLEPLPSPYPFHHLIFFAQPWLTLLL